MEPVCTIYIKNTFINVFDAEEFKPAKRHHSYPPPPRDQGSSVKHLTFLEELQKAPVYHTHGGAPVQAGEVEDSGDEAKSSDEEAPISSEKPASSKKRRRRANRPCKTKRERHLRFVMRTCSEVDKDPTSFNLCHVDLPPSLTSNPKKYLFFQAQIQSYQQQLLNSETSLVSDPVCQTYLRNLARDQTISQLGKW